jgi:hypothetical protein
MLTVGSGLDCIFSLGATAPRALCISTLWSKLELGGDSRVLKLSFAGFPQKKDVPGTGYFFVIPGTTLVVDFYKRTSVLKVRLQP